MDVKAMGIGLTVLASIRDGDMKVAQDVKEGKHEEEVKTAFYFLKHLQLPQSKEDLVSVQGNYDTLINLIQMAMVRSDQYLERLQRDLKKLELKQAKLHLQKLVAETNAKHELGTVAEIAQKLGISKSEVRKRKREGTLDLSDLKQAS